MSGEEYRTSQDLSVYIDAAKRKKWSRNNLFGPVCGDARDDGHAPQRRLKNKMDYINNNPIDHLPMHMKAAFKGKKES